MARGGLAERYRHVIDRGKTHDKVAVPDPAAASFHTDSEASGSPTSDLALAASARDQMRQNDPESPTLSVAVPGRGQQHIPERSVAWLISVAFAAMVLVGLGTAYLTLN